MTQGLNTNGQLSYFFMKEIQKGHSVCCNNTLPYTFSNLGEDVTFELKGCFIVGFRIEA